MKIFLAQIYCLFLLVMMKYKYYRNENISGTNLLLIPFSYDKVLKRSKSFKSLYRCSKSFKSV